MSQAGSRAFQEDFPHIHCFGCGVDNPAGLGIRSYWREVGISSEAGFLPAPHHCAGPRSCVNGGIIATLIDCHAICTAMAEAGWRGGREPGAMSVVQYATASLQVQYLKPARMGQMLRAVAMVSSADERKTRLTVEVSDENGLCARGEVLAVRVPDNWMP